VLQSGASSIGARESTPCMVYCLVRTEQIGNALAISKEV